MEFTAKVEDVLNHLETIRAEQGEEAYQKAVRDLAVRIVNTPGGYALLAQRFPFLDLKEIEREAQELTGKQVSEQQMIEMLRAKIPNLRTRTQLDLFEMAFEALCFALNSYYSGDLEMGHKAKDGVMKALTIAERLHEVEARVQEIPEDQRSQNAQNVVVPISAESAEAERLLEELEGITSAEELAKWYQANRSRLDTITTPGHRNRVFDAIRAKRDSWAN